MFFVAPGGDVMLAREAGSGCMEDGGARRRAIALFEAGAYAEAAAALVALLARIPAEPALLRLCGMALLRGGEVGRGLPYLARARRLAPRDPVAASWHGIGLQACDRPAEAERALREAIALDRTDPAPLVHLARVLLRLSKHDEALGAARQAVCMAPALLEARHALHLAEVAALTASAARHPGEPHPDDPVAPRLRAAAWTALAGICLRLDKIGDARAASIEALAALPLDAQAQTTLATIEHLGGAPFAAKARLHAVLARCPQWLAARIALAELLLLDNDAPAAMALLDGEPHGEHRLRTRWQAVRISALIALGRYQAAEAALARVTPPVNETEIILRWQHSLLARAAGDHAIAAALAERVAHLARDRAAAGPLERIHAHFALADLRHAEGGREQAFGHWQQGHALLRAAQPFSRGDHAASLEAVTRAYGRVRLAAGPRADLVDRAPVFIVGLPRTGTTLLEHILSAHPQVHGAGERLAIRETLVELTGTTDALSAPARAASLDAATLTEAARRYLATLHDLSPGALVVLDKMPDNIMHLGFIATLLPGARVICCTRDLRDVGASIFQRRFLGHHPYAHDPGDLGWYLAQQQRLLAHWRAALPIPMLELDHAEWLADFDTTARRVLGFLGLPWDPACRRFFEQDRPVRTASRDQVREPINARGVGRWRAYAEPLAPMLRALADRGERRGTSGAARSEADLQLGIEQPP